MRNIGRKLKRLGIVIGIIAVIVIGFVYFTPVLNAISFIIAVLVVVFLANIVPWAWLMDDDSFINHHSNIFKPLCIVYTGLTLLVPPCLAFKFPLEDASVFEIVCSYYALIGMGCILFFLFFAVLTFIIKWIFKD